MKISLNWIKEYTDLKLTPEELKERLSVSLTEVEHVESFGDRFDGIIVAEVKDIKKHPNSEKLLVLELDTGKRNVSVVVQDCPVKVGDKVPYLAPGVVVPGEIGCGDSCEKVKKTDVKGVESDGMVPSGREIGLSHDHTTVYTVDSDTRIGTPLSKTLDLTDYVLEIKNKALTHRPDTFSIEGLAREIAALQGTKYKPLEWLYDCKKIRPQEPDEDKLPLKIVNNAEALCKRYIAVVLEDVEVKPSPQWLQIRLAKLGIRPVNNIVDISNYLMVEAGQPSHAFDYDKVVNMDPEFDKTAVITIRMAEGGEKLTTLDGQQKELYDETIVIADNKNPIGVAGVMGGLPTEIGDDTKRVIFQVENLDMYNVRRTSMKLGIFSDAVTRFSKGLDPNRCEPVLYKGIQMMQELAGARLASKIRDYYKEPVGSHFVTVAPDKVRGRLGVDISDVEMIEILSRLGLIAKRKENEIVVEVPSWRPDLRIPQDIDEEVVRIYGYDRIDPTLPTRKILPVMFDSFRANRLKLKSILAEIGAYEMYLYSFVGTELYKKCNLSLQNSHRVINPLSPDLEYMRPILLPSLLEKVPANYREHGDYVSYEIDMVNPVGSKDYKKDQLPEEPWHLSLVHTADYYSAKLYLETALDRMNVKDYEVVPEGTMNKKNLPDWIKYASVSYHPSRLAYVKAGGDFVGLIGQVGVPIAEEMDLPETTSAFEMNLSALDPNIQTVSDYKDPSKYPSVIHDFCFVVDSDVPYAALEQAITRVDPKSEIIRKVDCLDVYSGGGKKKSQKTTVRVTMQSYEKTLEESEIEALREKVVKSVKKEVGGKLAE